MAIINDWVVTNPEAAVLHVTHQPVKKKKKDFPYFPKH